MPPPSGTPTDPPTDATTVDPTIAGPGDITTATGLFRGTGTPGDGVRVADPAAPSGSICIATVSGSGAWSCTGAVRSGPQQVFTVIDTTDSALHPDDAPASDVIVPPTVTPSGPTTGGVTGTGLPGAAVTVSASGTTGVRTTTIASDGHWYVSWGAGVGSLGDGRVTMTATQAASTGLGFRSDLRSAPSAPATVTIDRTAPAAPVLTSPAAGSRVRTQPVSIGGTGESGAVLTVYVDQSPVCQTTVTNGRWACSTAGESIPAGTRSLVAVQRDTAGNFSERSTALSVVVVGAPVDSTPSSAAPAPSGSASSSASAAPGEAVPGGSAPGDDGSSSGGGSPGGGDSSGGDAVPVPDAGWSVATTYDAAVPTIQSAVSLRTLIVVLIGVLVFLALVAAPLKLLVRTTRGRVLWHRARFTGRNRSAAERSIGDDAGTPAWAVVGLSVALGSVLALLGTGIAAEPRYARLAIAVVLGTTVLAVGVVLSTRLAAGADRNTVTYRLSPALVAAALLACVATRSLDLSPAVLLGVLVVPTARTGPEAVVTVGRALVGCGRSATWRTGTLLVLVAVGWVLHSAVGRGGFWGELVSEFAITLCVGGIGSLVTTLLPVAGSAGAALWSTSRARYASLASIGIALAVAVYSGPTGTHVSLVAMAVAVATCAVVGLVAWMWVAVVEPVLRG